MNPWDLSLPLTPLTQKQSRDNNPKPGSLGLDGPSILVVHSQNLCWVVTVSESAPWVWGESFIFRPIRRKFPPPPLLETQVSLETNSLETFL